jgi:uncharacterized protein (DUF58 family)
MSGRPRQQRLHVAPSVWPTLLGAAVSFALAAHERLVWPQIVGCVLVAIVATSLVGVARQGRFSVELAAPAQAIVGEALETTLRITNHASVGRGSLLVRQRWRGSRRLVPELVAFVDVVVPAGDDVVVRTRRTALARGAADTVEVEIEIAGAFGFFSRMSRQSWPQQLLVLPAPAPSMDVLASDGLQTGAAGGRIPDVDVRGVRDWRAGDRISHVHWRSVVRTGRMTVLDREGASAGSLAVLLLAPGKRGRPVKDALFETSVSVAAATAASALRAGTSLCVVAQPSGRAAKGTKGVVRHPLDEASLLECLARVETAVPPSDEVLGHALSHAGAGGTLLVVAAGATPPAWRSRIFDAAAAVGVTAVDVADLHRADTPDRMPA